jgi:hypothetical protein
MREELKYKEAADMIAQGNESNSSATLFCFEQHVDKSIAIIFK